MIVFTREEDDEEVDDTIVCEPTPPTLIKQDESPMRDKGALLEDTMVPEKPPKKETKRPTWNLFDEPDLDMHCLEFDEFLVLQETHDSLHLTDLIGEKLTLVGIKGNDRSDKGTLIDQAVVKIDDTGQPGKTSIPSPLEFPSLVTKHYVHDTVQGNTKEREK
ncbi:uncharacterized protein G2W53_029046 [Senna tora]|uniref:Uncharacterized protein n=1 Tax=Senna tora TaxID=362788 RepID=A0A834WAB4_9FABA|nr:uncharacterized protein G2W53_029046 [Senna tora]